MMSFFIFCWLVTGAVASAFLGIWDQSGNRWEWFATAALLAIMSAIIAGLAGSEKK